MKDYHAREADVARALAETWPKTIQCNVTIIEEFPNAKHGIVRLIGARLSFIVEAECVDGEIWMHLSVCGQSPKRVPDWAELRWCKDYFLGDRKAVQVLPSRSEYVNLHPHVLHLYAPLERDPLPDFRGIDETGRLGI